MASSSLREQNALAARERILSAVAELIERADPGELTMPAVAEASGISLRTVYRYYPTREELLEAAGRWIGDELYKHPYPRDLDEVADLYEEGCHDFDERPGSPEPSRSHSWGSAPVGTGAGSGSRQSAARCATSCPG